MCRLQCVGRNPRSGEGRPEAGRGGERPKLTTAHGQYAFFVGEVGIPADDFLYHRSQWELNAIARGYYRRSRTQWEATRWQTWWILSGVADIRSVGIYKPVDLIRFPWESNRTVADDDLPNTQEVERLRELMRRENEAIEQQQKK